MEITTVCPYSFGANTYLIFSGNHALVVDPAVSVDKITNAVAERGAVLEGILLTHGHFDHTIALDTLRKATKVCAYVHKNDAIMLTDGRKNAYYDFYGKESRYAPAEHLIEDADVIRLGDEKLTVIHTPGHTGGSVCFLGDGFLVTGDTLFADSIGRTDLWSGSMEEIRASLEKLRELSPTLTIYPGHGAPAALGYALDNSAYYL